MGMRDDAYVPPAVNGARFLRLLADETRLRILALLGKTPDLCVCEFVAILRLPQYQISRHLGQLRRSGLLTSRREGPFVFYSVAEAARRHSLYRLILRAIPQLASRQVVTGDLGRMRRLVKLEQTQRLDACSAKQGLRVLRGRSILRPATGGG
jgi:ArsR family transcriptional regulator, arsenate/arsenite/antimonite-responsive transcriptional repressor